MKFLRYVVNKEGIKVYSQDIEVAMKWKVPKSPLKLEALLGLQVITGGSSRNLRELGTLWLFFLPERM